MSLKIFLVLNWIFEFDVDWNVQDFESLREKKVGHLVGER
jgi:hypothetical protein